MTMINKYLAALAILLIVIVAIILLFFPKIGSKSEQEENSRRFPDPKPLHKLAYSGAISYFTAEPGINSFKQNFPKLDFLSLFWYQLNSDGTISRHNEIKADTEGDILSFAKQNQKPVLMGVENGADGDRVELLLKNSAARKKHIAEILSLLERKGYDGLIVDYEGLEQNQAKDFTQYIREVSEAIRNKGKIISVAIEIETEGRIFHGMDIVDIAKLVDRVELSTYEEFSEKTGPGPIASIAWVNTIIKNILNQGVSPEKIVLGTAHAGHDWIISSKEEFFKDDTTKNALNLLRTTNSNLVWDENKKSSFFKYQDEKGQKHVVWLEDTQSFKAKIDIAKAYQLQGIFIWYLGGEDSAIWEQIKTPQ